MWAFHKAGQAAEVVSSKAASASCYDFIEYVGVLAIVEPERKLVEVQR